MTTEQTPDLVGLTEIAEMYGVHKQTVNGWRRNSAFPSPAITLAMGPVWNRSEVAAWKSPPRYPRPGDGEYVDLSCAWCKSKRFDSFTLTSIEAVHPNEPAFKADCQDCGKTTHIRFYTANIDGLTIMTRQYTPKEEA